MRIISIKEKTCNLLSYRVFIICFCIGVISATEGTVLINGKNIEKHLDFIRNDLGLCPQENMVFPDLNVLEQLEFFGLVSNSVTLSGIM